MSRAFMFEPDQAAILSVLNIFFPPLSVAIVKGCTKDVAINFGLFLLGWFPGLFHGFWIIAKHTRPALPTGEADEEAAIEGTRLVLPSPPNPPFIGLVNHHAQSKLHPGGGYYAATSPAGASPATTPDVRSVMARQPDPAPASALGLARDQKTDLPEPLVPIEVDMDKDGFA